jgi:polyisoprenoid-binding protein YceI
VSGYLQISRKLNIKGKLMRNLVSFFAVALTLFLTFSTNSLFAKEWKMNEESSSVRFIYSLEGAAFRGRFRNFSADINFDPSNPEDGSINGVVSIESSRSSSAEHDEYLMEEDWFNPKEFPESTFKSDKIEIGDNDKYLAYGQLNLAGVDQPITMEFEFDVADDKAQFSGYFMIKRLLFGVGWDTTNWIADEVDVQIKLELE